jgi:hypothetical protein
MEIIREQLKSYLGSSTAPTCSNRLASTPGARTWPRRSKRDPAGDSVCETLRREQGTPELSEEALMELEVPEDETHS